MKIWTRYTFIPFGNFLYSCWPITKDEILPDMTDMKAGATYEFMSCLPPFLERKREKLKAGNWNKRISFPKEQGRISRRSLCIMG